MSKLDKDFLERNGLKEEDREFKRNLEIVWEGLDLSDMRNVYGFIDRVKKRSAQRHLRSRVKEREGKWGRVSSRFHPLLARH